MHRVQKNTHRGIGKLLDFAKTLHITIINRFLNKFRAPFSSTPHSVHESEKRRTGNQSSLRIESERGESDFHFRLPDSSFSG